MAYLVCIGSIGVHAKQSLRQQMFDFAGPINQNDIQNNMVVDIRNGYLSLEGSYDRNGFDMGAFKDSRGNYLLIKQNYTGRYGSPLPNAIQLRPKKSKAFKGVLHPKLFIPDLYELIPNGINPFGYAPFQYDIDIPSKGTDMEVRMQLEYLNYQRQNSQLASLKMGDSIEKKVLIKLQDIASKIKVPDTIQLIMQGKFEQINSRDLSIINQVLRNKTLASHDKIYREAVLYRSNHVDQFTNLEQLKNGLKHVYLIYLLNKNIKNKVILGWNRQKAKFYVKKVVPIQTGEDQISFIEFLSDSMNYHNDADHPID